MTVIYRIDGTRVPVTQRGVSNNQSEGWGSHLALLITEGFISARSDVQVRQLVSWTAAAPR